MLPIIVMAIIVGLIVMWGVMYCLREASHQKLIVTLETEMRETLRAARKHGI